MNRRLTRMAGAALCIFALAACSAGDAGPTAGAGPTEPSSPSDAGVEPLPRFPAPTPIAYSAADRRSPFFAASTTHAASQAAAGKGPAPEPQRPKQHLEGFPLADLAFAGALAQGRVREGLVRDGDGRVHPVRVGDYLGTHQGRILRIEQAAITVTELVPTGNGDWVERRQALRAPAAEATP